MDLSAFTSSSPGSLVPINGNDGRSGEWTHRAFVPHPLTDTPPYLSPATYLRVADARAALAALDSTARQLPNPSLLRQPSLRREAQSTSALEGTYEPLPAVLTADAEGTQTLTMREVLNFVHMAQQAFDWVGEQRPLTVSMLSELQRTLVRGTPTEGPSSGKIRDIQVVIGQVSAGVAPLSAAHSARFIPPPPGTDLESQVADLLRWLMVGRRSDLEPVVSAALGHYQFETLHPFHDGNGRIGRLLIVLHLQLMKLIDEPTLTVSPWFETRRSDYYDRLYAVSSNGEWDQWVAFFARGLEDSALRTRDQMLRLSRVQADLKETVRSSALRADNAQLLVDYATAHPAFTVRHVERDLGVSYPRAKGLIQQLCDLGVLQGTGATYRQQFSAPAVLQVLLADSSGRT